MSGATVLGSLPGRDFPAAARLMLSDVPDLPCLPELPARGPWAGMIGRAAALLAGLDAEFAAGQWRLAAHPGVDLRRARGLADAVVALGGTDDARISIVPEELIAYRTARASASSRFARFLSTYIFLSAWRNSSRRVLPSKSLAMAQPAA